MIKPLKRLRANIDRVSAAEYNRIVDYVTALMQSFTKSGFLDSSGLYLRRPPIQSLRFVDRGTADAIDFVHTDLTIDATYNDLDLSSIVDSNAKAVLLACRAQLKVAANTASMKIYLKAKADENPLYNNTGLFAMNALINPGTFDFGTSTAEFFVPWVEGQFIIPLSDDRKIQYLINTPAADWNLIMIVINGWFI